MPKYALVVTADERLLPGVHAMLNAMRYYGTDNVEFHFLYWPCKNNHKFIADMQASGFFPFLKPIDLLDMKNQEGPEEQGYKPVYYLKFYRSYYAALLTDYDAVGFLDADRAITGDIGPYFQLAEKSGKILMVDHKFNKQRLDSGFYDKYQIQGTSGCPYDPSATFFDPKIWGKYFEQVHYLGRAVVKNSEMPTMNYMLIKNNLLWEPMIRLPTARWNVRRWGSLSTIWEQRPEPVSVYGITVMDSSRLYIDDISIDKLYWYWKDLKQTQAYGIMNLDKPPNSVHLSALAPAPNILWSMISIHGRWWFRETLQRKPAKMAEVQDKRKHPGFLVQNHNIANIWEVFKFFNFNCYTRLEPWMPEWGNEHERIVPETGELIDET